MPTLFNNLTKFTADRAWGAKDIALIEGASVRLHWTDKPYKWHINDGNEVFMVIDGMVEMDYKLNGKIHTASLGPNDIFMAELGDEHIARPIGEARILVIEKQGSV
ncbi:cupin [Hirschia litorea]|uniref:Cupin n=1 Tax=Hirschia litorea TaxID=1199156 RepID=A0ABW2IKT1_9PROT